jgi:hypothetical protein
MEDGYDSESYPLEALVVVVSNLRLWLLQQQFLDCFNMTLCLRKLCSLGQASKGKMAANTKDAVVVCLAYFSSFEKIQEVLGRSNRLLSFDTTWTPQKTNK